MGFGYTKECPNVYFRARKNASIFDDALKSRERVAEMLDLSVSSLADYELGKTKVVPPENVWKMSELYCSPELRNWYCVNECPLGQKMKLITEEEPMSIAVLRLIKAMHDGSDLKFLDKLSVMAMNGLEDCDADDIDEMICILDDIAYAISGVIVLEEKALGRHDERRTVDRRAKKRIWDK